MYHHPPTRAARQFCSHGHVYVNDKKVDVPSYILKVGDKVGLEKKLYENQVYLTAKDSPRLELADYLEIKDEDVPTAYVRYMPKMDNVPFPLQAGLFSEYYAMRKV